MLSSGLKAAATWSRVDILQNCRECCGGQGFLAANKIGPMKTDMDVDVTFEGDNTVMMQQVSTSEQTTPANCTLCVKCGCLSCKVVLGLQLLLQLFCSQASSRHKQSSKHKLCFYRFRGAPTL